MTFATTLTQKGQMTFTKTMRELLGVYERGKISIYLKDKRKKTITIVPLPKLSDLAGSFKVTNHKDPVKIREYMEINYNRE